jgi:hypothetical protein
MADNPPSHPAFTIPSILGVICAVMAFGGGAARAFLLAILAIVFGAIGFLLALLPGKRGGIVSILSIIIGAIGIIAGIVKLIR